MGVAVCQYNYTQRKQASFGLRSVVCQLLFISLSEFVLSAQSCLRSCHTEVPSGLFFTNQVEFNELNCKKWCCWSGDQRLGLKHHRGSHTGSPGNVQAHLWLGAASGTWWVEARDAAQHPSMHRTAPTAKNDLDPNINRAEAETPQLKHEHGYLSSLPAWVPLYGFLSENVMHADDKIFD